MQGPRQATRRDGARSSQTSKKAARCAAPCHQRSRKKLPLPRGSLRAQDRKAGLRFARCAGAAANTDSIACRDRKRTKRQSISANRRTVVAGAGKFFRRVSPVAKTSNPAAGTRGSASFEMAAGKPDLEADLRSGRENLQAWPARAREND